VTSKAKRQRPFTLNDLPDKSSLNGTIAQPLKALLCAAARRGLLAVVEG
jgi:hypothetical protein